MLKAMWQDYVFSIGLIVFNIALIPAIRSKTKPPLGTSVPTALIQCIFVVAFASLEMWLSVAGTIVLALLWSTLAAQKLQQIHKPTVHKKKLVARARSRAV